MLYNSLYKTLCGGTVGVLPGAAPPKQKPRPSVAEGSLTVPNLKCVRLSRVRRIPGEIRIVVKLGGA